MNPSQLGGKKNRVKRARGTSPRKKKEFVATEIKKCEIPADKLPRGAVLHDYLSWNVQEIVVEAQFIEVQRARYKLPDGSYITAEMPQQFEGSHFGPTLRAHIVNLSQNGRMTQNKILEYLSDLGIQISEGQIDQILATGSEALEPEFNDIQQTGLSTTSHLHVDITGGRDQRKNVHTMVMGGPHFAIFQTMDSKSRITILKTMQGVHSGYAFNQSSLDYLEFKLGSESKEFQRAMVLADMCKDISCRSEDEWLVALEQRRVTHVSSSKVLLRYITEAALIGHLMTSSTLNKRTCLLSDGAPEFAFLVLHQLCWVHAERIIKKLIPVSEQEIKEVDGVLDDIWTCYREIKTYRENPTHEHKEQIKSMFQMCFGDKQIAWGELKQAVHDFYGNKDRLLLVLDEPHVPPHNNASENDLRSSVIMRKIKGETRSARGRKARDILASLYKTCRKLGIPFLKFLRDRFAKTNTIAYLPDIIRERSASSPPATQAS